MYTPCTMDVELYLVCIILLYYYYIVCIILKYVNYLF